eukprot:251468-Hanusia_phi.AAC.1
MAGTGACRKPDCSSQGDILQRVFWIPFRLVRGLIMEASEGEEAAEEEEGGGRTRGGEKREESKSEWEEGKARRGGSGESRGEGGEGWG